MEWAVEDWDSCKEDEWSIVVRMMCVADIVKEDERGKLLNAVFYQAEDGIRDVAVTGVQTCALPIYSYNGQDKIKIL